jgi:hypothetical protein
MELADFLCGRFYKYAAPTTLEKRGATKVKVPPLVRAVLVLMGFNITGEL